MRADVEVDQRAVPGPPATPTGVLDLRRERELLGDDAHRVVDDEGLVGAEVVDVSAGLSSWRSAAVRIADRQSWTYR